MSAGAVAASAESVPAMAVIRIATSSTLRPIGPGVSWLCEIGTTWVRETRPTVGFSPTRPANAAGQVTEPSVSVPTPTAASDAAMAEPAPDEEPQALRSST